MELKTFFLSLSLSLCALATGSSRLWSQSCTQLQTGTVTCQSQGCSTSQVVSLPQNSDYGVIAACGSVYCCGTYIPNCYSRGGCATAELKEPKAAKALALLAESNSLLVADCHGVYRHFETKKSEEQVSSWHPEFHENLMVR